MYAQSKFHPQFMDSSCWLLCVLNLLNSNAVIPQLWSLTYYVINPNASCPGFTKAIVWNDALSKEGGEHGPLWRSQLPSQCCSGLVLSLLLLLRFHWRWETWKMGYSSLCASQFHMNKSFRWRNVITMMKARGQGEGLDSLVRKREMRKKNSFDDVNLGFLRSNIFVDQLVAGEWKHCVCACVCLCVCV